MISNERRWPSQQPYRPPQRPNQWNNQRPAYYDRPAAPPRPPSVETSLEIRRLQVEKKQLVLELKENPRGRFIRITENVRGRSNAIIIPAPGLLEFQQLLQ